MYISTWYVRNYVRIMCQGGDHSKKIMIFVGMALKPFAASPLGRSPYYRLPRNSAAASRSARTPARHRRGVGLESVRQCMVIGDSANTKGIYIMGT